MTGENEGRIPNLALVLGVVLVAAGLGLVFFAWARTAGLTVVSLQVPYVISAGVLGVAVVVVGLTVVNIAVKRTESRAKVEQMAELQAVLAELRDVLDGKSDR